MKRIGFSIMVGAALLGSITARGNAYNLGDLIASGGAITVGDKTFADFKWMPTAGMGGMLVPASSVMVVPLTDDSHLYGIEIVAGLSASGVGFSDAVLQYSVTAAPGHLISDVHQSIVGGGSAMPEGFWSISSSEVGRADPGGPAVVISTVGNSVMGPIDLDDSPGEPGDILNLNTPLSTLWITKDINASAVNGFAQISIIDQRFSQVPVQIPDVGTTVSLLGLAMLSVGGLRCRCRK